MKSLTNQIISDFKDADVTVYFGVQGGACARIIEAVIKNNCKYIPVLNEQAAGYAAHGYFLTHGMPAGIILTSGPGVTNSISGIASCYYDSVPLVVLMGQVNAPLNLAKTFSTKMHGFQELPHIDLVKPVSSVSLSIRSEADYESQRYAIFHLLEEKKKVVSIEIQDDVQRIEIKKMKSISKLTKITNNELLNKNNQAKLESDLLILGAGCRDSLSEADIDNINLSEVPVVLSWGAQSLSSQLKYCRGLFGTHTPGVANELVKKSVSPIVVGCSLLQHQIGKNQKLFLPKAKLITFVNSNPSENHRAFSIFGDRLFPYLSDASEFFRRNSLIINKKLNSIENEQYNIGNPVVPNILSDVIKKFSKYGTNIFTDAGATLSWSYQAMNMDNNWKLGSKMYSSFNLHPMGFSNCALVGSGVNSNDITLAIIGDGSVPMNCQELAHLKNKKNLKIVVIDNKGYGIIRQTQDDFYGGVYLGSSFETESPLPYFSIGKIAKGFDLTYKVVKNTDYDLKLIDNFFTGDDQILIFDVNSNHKVLTDFYNS